MKLSPASKEKLIISVGWMLIYAFFPLYMHYALQSINATFDLREMMRLWGYLTAFCVMFLLNHFVFIPKFINKKHYGQYAICIAVMIIVFIAFLKYNTPQMPPRNGEAIVTKHTIFWLAPPDLFRLVMAILIIGVDLGAVAWLNEQKMRQQLLLLGQQNLEQELQHLRYQINPHFFMNTLNNIHVLVDLDQDRAKRAIVELSGLMRYALYEGNSNMAPLSHEVDFLQLYISLMKLRYNNKVEITCDMPGASPSEVMMPPMLLATFVENAFKHGVSYQEQSFIHVALTADEKERVIHFRCENSRHVNASSTEDGHHGIGLENVRKRLDLQYADNYTLNIEDNDNQQFVVDLQLPFKN